MGKDSKEILDEVMDRKRELRRKYGIQPPPPDFELFMYRPGSPRHHYALVKGFNTWDSIAEGFRRGADKLANSVLNSGSEQDYLIYPICLLYRFYLEIRLKELLVASGQSKGISNYGHDIKKLWKDARLLVEEYSGAPPEHITAIERVIDQFHRADPRAESFRYPADKAGSPLLPDTTQVDIGQLRGIIAVMAGDLDGASTGLYERMADQDA